METNKYTSKQPGDEKLDEMALSQYGDMFDSENEMWWYKSLRDILRWRLNLQKDLNKLKVADLGCGTGINLKLLQDVGFKNPLGIDLSDTALKFCKERGLENVKLGSVTDLDIPDNALDVVLLMDVVSMLTPKQTDDCISEIYRTLKSGGELYLHTAALPWLFSQHDSVCNVKKRYYLPELKKIFNRQEWSVEIVSYRYFFLFPIIATIKFYKNLTQRLTKTATSDQGVPPKFINQILTKICYFENYLVAKGFRYPIGSSLFIVLKKV